MRDQVTLRESPIPTDPGGRGRVRSQGILVAGLGNVLLGDDAFGPHVVELLSDRFAFPDEVELLDLGTPGLNLHPFLAERSALILVDALRSRRPPGTVLRIGREDLLRRPPPPRVSPHDLGLKESLSLVELAEGRPLPVVLIGVVAEQCDQGAPMSESVESAVPGAMAACLDELRALGVEPVERPERPEAARWWSNPPLGEALHTER